MYAVIQTGGKQYKVAPNDTLRVEKLAGKAGDTVALDQVLALHDGKATKIGTPLLSDTAVKAEIVAQEKGEKVTIFKKKRRQNYRRTRGHRQELTTLRITDIGTGAKAAPAKKAEEKKAPAKTDAKQPDAPKAAAKADAADKPAAKPVAKKTDK